MAANIPYREDKIKNAVCFFASEHERLTSRPLTHASLYKYLAFLDYASIEKTGRPALGLLYRTKGRRPLPVHTYAKLHSLWEDRFIFLPRGQGGYLVRPTAEPDLRSFSPLEVSEMKSLIETYAHRFAKARDAGEAAPEATGFWKRTWTTISESMGFDDVFEDDVFIM
ncbi:MAG: hypothetical protein ABSD38_09800 [Syntrophorhabdales bacterium]|jgi:hypothetical protein